MFIQLEIFINTRCQCCSCGDPEARTVAVRDFHNDITDLSPQEQECNSETVRIAVCRCVLPVTWWCVQTAVLILLQCVRAPLVKIDTLNKIHTEYYRHTEISSVFNSHPNHYSLRRPPKCLRWRVSATKSAPCTSECGLYGHVGATHLHRHVWIIL